MVLELHNEYYVNLAMKPELVEGGPTQLRFLLYLIISAAPGAAQARDVHYPIGLTPLNTTPTFDRGWL
jgi:hypothetical protein